MNTFTVLLALHDSDETWMFMETVTADTPMGAINAVRESARASGGAGGKVVDVVVIEGSHQCRNPYPQGTEYGDTWPLDALT